MSDSDSADAQDMQHGHQLATETEEENVPLYRLNRRISPEGTKMTRKRKKRKMMTTKTKMKKKMRGM